MLMLLVPFLVTTTMYFQLLIPSDRPSLSATVIKCLPVWSLAAAAHIYSQSYSSKYNRNYSRLIVWGLICSSIGDAFLVWPKYFPVGMIAFAVAHCFYISAFGFKPWNFTTGITLFSLAALVLWLVLPKIKDEIIFFGMPIYSLFLITMAWRALSRTTIGHDAWKWPKVCCALGSVLFVVSDALISFHDLQDPIPHGQELIMSTYYAAQFLIMLSVVSEGDKSKSQKTKKT